MNKNYLIALFAGATAFAQPVINQSNLMLGVESEAFIGETSSEIFDPGPGGPNKIWDFSNISLIPIGSSRTTAVAGTPSAAIFTTANFCSAATGEGQDAAYSYFRHDAQKMEFVGETYIGIGVINYTANPKTYLEFPYTYNKVINDTYKASLDDEATSFTSTYDAYGTLILEFGTYHNVVRQKITENGVTDYIWFNVNPFFPIIQTALADNVMGILKTDSALATDPFESRHAFRIFPNPASGAFQIDMKNFDGATVAVYDMLGKSVVSQKVSESLTQVDLSNHSCGVYFVKITTKDGQTATQKIVKK